jgi:hypothetical protein
MFDSGRICTLKIRIPAWVDSELCQTVLDEREPNPQPTYACVTDSTGKFCVPSPLSTDPDDWVPGADTAKKNELNLVASLKRSIREPVTRFVFNHGCDPFGSEQLLTLERLRHEHFFVNQRYLGYRLKGGDSDAELSQPPESEERFRDLCLLVVRSTLAEVTKPTLTDLCLLVLLPRFRLHTPNRLEFWTTEQWVPAKTAIGDPISLERIADAIRAPTESGLKRQRHHRVKRTRRM